jgi:hypothetical protein
MATDGVKIINSDLAEDLYAQFMDSFQEGRNFTQLNNQFLNSKAEFSENTIEYEICVTVYGLAFWEIGALTEIMLQEVQTVINQKNTVNYWAKEVGKETADARQKELDELLEKISKPNLNPIKRVKKQPKPNLFNIGDVLSFQHPDRNYGTAFIVDIYKMSGFSLYSICRTCDTTVHKPTMQDFLQSTFYASGTPTVDDLGAITTKLSVWVNQAERNELEKFFDCFSKIGKIDFTLPCGQPIITNDYQKFCDNSIYESQIAYSNSLGRAVDQFKTVEYAKVLE